MGLLTWLFGGGERFDIYHPKERLIYQYFNGKRMVHADPMVLYKRVAARGGDLEVASKVASSPLLKVTDKAKAHDDVVRYVREIFQLETPNGLECAGCLTETECVDLMDHFYTFVGHEKKNTNPGPTPSAATSASTPSPPDAAPPTGSSSDSGSAGNESSTASPGPSPSAPSSPWAPSAPE